MGFTRVKEEVRDGYLGDLPEELRVKIMNIHKLIVDIANSEFKQEKYSYLNNQQWAKTMLNEFLVVPKDKDVVGSVRVYKKGKRYRCMIQLTGHVENNRNTEDEEFFHGFIRNVHTAARAKVRRKFDMTLTCESEHGEHFEGFDIWTKQKVAKEIWDLFGDKLAKTIKPMKESTEDYQGANTMVVSLEELPEHLQELVESMNAHLCENLKHYGSIYKTLTESITKNGSIIDKLINECSTVSESSTDIGYTFIRKGPGGIYEGSIMVTPEYDINLPDYIGRAPKAHFEKVLSEMENLYSDAWEEAAEEFYKDNPTKQLIISGKAPHQYFEFQLSSDYAEKLWEYLENNTEVAEGNDNKKQKDESVIKEATDEDGYSVEWDPFTEADNTPEYNVDMTEAQARRTLRTLSQSIINDSQKKDYMVSQYTADIYANIITKNLLPLWAKGYRKVSIRLDDYQSFFTFEFKIPPMTQDFVARFVEGRESINGLLHRNPEIKIKMSPRIFHTMKNPDDAFNFFKAAIKYYDSGVTSYSNKLMAEVMKLNRELKHLVSTSKLSGIVTCPMQMLFIFDDVHMDNKDTFKITQNDIKTVNQFVKNIYTKYAAPEKEKKQIVDDLQKVVRALRESCEFSENIASITHLPESVEALYNGAFDKELSDFREAVINENTDWDWCRNNPNPEIRYLQEKFGVKKLKKIPSDLVAYITIETECIKDANDKMMIASYTLSKIEIVEWYIELLEAGSKKYIVPHSKPYLESVRTQLLACYKKIMETPIPKSTDRPLIDIKYPKGYEG